MAMKDGTVLDIQNQGMLDQLARSGALTVVHFWAAWAPQCEHMNAVMEELAKINPKCKFGKVEAEAQPDVSAKYEVVAVPTIVFIRWDKVVDKLGGADAAALTAKVAELSKDDTAFATPEAAASKAAAAAAPAGPVEDLDTKLKRLVNAAPVMLFMKGKPDDPKCGFSRQTIALLKEVDAKFSYFDILLDDEVRQGLKAYSDWPTFPQLYIKGELVGGLDILKEMKESGDLQRTLPKPETEEVLTQRIKDLLSREPVMLFMKGTPSAPRCGFSRTIVQLLWDQGVSFGHYDILGDEALRQGLKKISDWPTYPQLYHKGELLGGLDIIKEMAASGDLKKTIGIAE